MSREETLYEELIKAFKYEPTPCQDNLFRQLSQFLCDDEGDILVVNGFAGTGKTSAIAAAVKALRSKGIKSELLAPTGRSAKVLEAFSNRPAHTIHKCIYRQSTVGADGFGQFKLAPNKSKNTLFVVDEVSLIGIEAQEAKSSMLFGTGNLLEDLVTYVRNGNDCKMILMGDSAQLPPVGLECSPALSEEYMSKFGGVRFCSLDTVVRQAEESGILSLATDIRRMIESGAPADLFDELHLNIKGMKDVERVSGSELIEAISEAYSHYGEDETLVLCRSNKRAIRYNMGIRSTVQFKEERLVRDDKLMIVKNCYQFVEDMEGMDYIANGDIALLERIRGYEERYGLHFAQATLRFPDYGDQEIDAKVCLDTLDSESAALTFEQQDALYKGVSADYADLGSKKKIWEAVREDKYFNALQLKYASAITCHKSQGGQWKCIFIDCPFWQDVQTMDDLKWLYTAVTRATEKIYLVNFKDRFFK